MGLLWMLFTETVFFCWEIVNNMVVFSKKRSQLFFFKVQARCSSEWVSKINAVKCKQLNHFLMQNYFTFHFQKRTVSLVRIYLCFSSRRWRFTKLFMTLGRVVRLVRWFATCNDEGCHPARNNKKLGTGWHVLLIL